MKELPLALRLYIGIVLALGSAVLAVAIVSMRVDEPARFLLFLLLSSLTSILKLSVPLPRVLSRNGLTMSLSFTMNFAALLVLGAQEATVVAVVGAWSQCTFNVRQRNPRHRTLFSMAALAITFAATGYVYHLCGGAVGGLGSLALPTGPLGWSDELLALAAAASTHFAVNTGLVAGAIALSAGQPFVRVWSENFLFGWINQLFGGAVGVLLARGVLQTHYWLMPITTLLLYLTYRTYQAYHERIAGEQRAVQRMSDLHEATVESLALAIDAKDRHSRAHLRRLQTFSVALAESLRLPEEQVQAIRTAALLHDIGMLAVPQHIASKTGRLSDEEQKKLRIHPVVGAEIVRDVPFPSPVAPLIRGHHERWDGTGYPAGLRGEDIPIGARIVAIVDRFDAILNEHTDITLNEAMRCLNEEAGRALDPRLVARFIELLPHWRHGDLPARGEASAPAAGALDHIALAHREGHTLYQLAQALSASLNIGDAMEQLVSRLETLVPFSTCALFLHDAERSQIACRFASGPGAPALEPLRMAVGAGPLGWVVEHERPLINVSLAMWAAAPGEQRREDDRYDDEVTRSLRSAVICPLVGDVSCLGVLVVTHPDVAFYQDEHRRILEQVGEQLSAAVQNAIRFERTREALLTDKLTGLANSHGLATAFEPALEQAVTNAEVLAVLMIDVDDFKAINDTYGHAAGDRALREVANVLSQSVRARDICARYAGDEFVLVLMRCGGPEAERRGLELQAMFQAVRFAPENGGRLEPLNISVGAAAFPADGPSLEALLAVADRRMYRDKHQRKRAGTGLRSLTKSLSA